MDKQWSMELARIDAISFACLCELEHCAALCVNCGDFVLSLPQQHC